MVVVVMVMVMVVVMECFVSICFVLF